MFSLIGTFVFFDHNCMFYSARSIRIPMVGGVRTSSVSVDALDVGMLAEKCSKLKLKLLCVILNFIDSSCQ